MSTLTLAIAVTAGLSLAMMAARVLQDRLGNGGWADVVWSFALGAAGAIYALTPAPGIAGPGARQILVAVLVLAWSVRLGSYLAMRSAQGHEDARYAQMRRDWGADFGRRMFWFLQIQATAAAVLALMMLLAARNPRPFGLGDLAGLAILAAAIVGEGVADAQLRRFAADPANRGQVCDVGLWRLSRHPNYFFEWLGWFAYPLFAIDLSGDYPQGWLALAGPAAMYWLLVHVSGIPPLEQHMLRSRGAAYRDYQDRTRPFLPWPRA